MIFPFQYGDDDGDKAVLLVPENHKRASCDNPINQNEKSIHFYWGETTNLYFMSSAPNMPP